MSWKARHPELFATRRRRRPSTVEHTQPSNEHDLRKETPIAKRPRIHDEVHEVSKVEEIVHMTFFGMKLLFKILYIFLI